MFPIVKQQQQIGAVMLGGHRGQIQQLAAPSREARGVGRPAVLQTVCSGARGVAVEAGGHQGSAGALGLWEALVVPVQTQILNGHQLT